MFELRTERLTFRPGVASDVEAIHAIVSNWEVVKNLGSWPYPADLAYTINRIVGRLDIDKGIAGTVRAGDEIIGGMGIVEGDLGYAFGPSAWGKGYATEISRRLVSYVMHCYDWPQLTAEAYADNPAVFWDLYGESGHPIRTTISEMGPLLLARMLGLNEVQEGVLNLVFRIADDQHLLLLDLKDLRAIGFRPSTRIVEPQPAQSWKMVPKVFVP